MPTYEYRCITCGAEFEQMQSMSEAPLVLCPKEVCPQEEKRKGTGVVERRISAGSGLVFKGSGFYITDYKNDRSGGESKKDSSSHPASSTPSATAPSPSSSSPSSTPATPNTSTTPKSEPTRESKQGKKGSGPNS